MRVVFEKFVFHRLPRKEILNEEWDIGRLLRSALEIIPVGGCGRNKIGQSAKLKHITVPTKLLLILIPQGFRAHGPSSLLLSGARGARLICLDTDQPMWDALRRAHEEVTFFLSQFLKAFNHPHSSSWDSEFYSS